MESCGLKCLKWLMFAFNLLFFICGCVLLGLGIWVVVDLSSFMELFSTSETTSTLFLSAAYIFIALGCALIVISFFGFCGAVKENRCLLGVFFAIVLVIFIVEIVGAILAFVYYPQVEEVIIDSMADYKPNNDTDPLTLAWDALQELIPCCGFNDSLNWVAYGPYPVLTQIPPQIVPASCCDTENDDSDLAAVALLQCQSLGQGVHAEGCETRLQSYFWVIGGVGIAILVIELLAMIFACCLFRAAGKEDNYA